MSRQQRMSVWGSVKTSAFEELEGEKQAFALVSVLDQCCSISWQMSLCCAPQRDDSEKPADLAKTRCAKGVFSALITVQAEGTGAWGQRSRLLDL